MREAETLDISVIIPFKDHSDLTIAALESLQAYANPVKEVILISNNSSDDELENVRAAASQYKNSKVLVYNHPFNFQKINNWGAAHATGKVLFLLNNDVELLADSTELLAKMYHKALQPDIGAVGCVLLYEDAKTIQHGGIYLIPGGTADHLYIGMKLATVSQRIKQGAYPYDITKDLGVNAVTAAALVVEKKKFDQVGGLNEAFLICGGDVDLCFRLTDKGYKSVLMGSESGCMMHKESRSRSSIGIPYVDFVESYKSYIKHFDLAVGDPYLHWQEIPRE